MQLELSREDLVALRIGYARKADTMIDVVEAKIRGFGRYHEETKKAREEMARCVKRQVEIEGLLRQLDD